MQTTFESNSEPLRRRRLKPQQPPFLFWQAEAAKAMPRMRRGRGLSGLEPLLHARALAVDAVAAGGSVAAVTGLAAATANLLPH